MGFERLAFAGAFLLCASLVAGCAVTPKVSPPYASEILFSEARKALREADALKAFRLHFQEQSRRSQEKTPPSSVDDAWRALSFVTFDRLEICPSGLPRDRAGVWKLAYFNRALRGFWGRSGSAPFVDFPFWGPGKTPWRYVGAHSVLAPWEVEGLNGVRASSCPVDVLFDATRDDLKGRNPRLKIEALQRWVETTEALAQGVDAVLVKNRSVLVARSLELRFEILRVQAQSEAEILRKAGKTPPIEEDTPHFPPDLSAMRLEKVKSWTVEDWLALTPPRRQRWLVALRAGIGEDAFQRHLLASLDQARERGDGAEVMAWVGLLEAGSAPERRAFVWQGARGEDLLRLEAGMGFTERGVVALHRARESLAQGDFSEGLRRTAQALSWASESRDAAGVERSARRLLGHVVGLHSLDASAVATLRALLPAEAQGPLWEDLGWGAVVRQDARSFTLVWPFLQRMGTWRRHEEWLKAMIEGRLEVVTAGFAGEDGQRLLRREAPFLLAWLEALQKEGLGVVSGHRDVLINLRKNIGSLSISARESEYQKAQEVLARLDALLSESSDVRDPLALGRSYGRDGRLFAGSIRLPPEGEFPWPFAEKLPPAPDPFAPFRLEPVDTPLAGPGDERSQWSVSGWNPSWEIREW